MNTKERPTSIDIHSIYKRDCLDTEEALVLDLASAIHRKRSPDRSVSWAAQVEAAEYFNEHGFHATLDRLHELWIELGVYNEQGA